MILKKLEMQGFKSFPDKTELEFDSGITAIVGPNGSGKSNIADAVKWVLGETSSKSLRGAKMEDVIFGGTSNRRALGYAQVRLTLDNRDRMLKNYGDTVTVTRRYYRSGESEYYINSESVRRRDIHELFMDTGLGSDSYSIISQGRVESIISSNNEERRDLFEEAAGISLFRYKRNEAERQLAAAQDNIVRLDDIVSELEERVTPLKEQSEKAKKFVELADEQKNLEIGIWLDKINKFTDELREHDHKIDAANVSYEQCENDLKNIESQINEENDTIANINVQIEDIKAAKARYREDSLRAENEISVAQTKIDQGSENITRREKEIEELDLDAENIKREISEKEEYTEKSGALVKEKREIVAKYQKDSSAVISEENELSAQSVKINEEIVALNRRSSEYEVRASVAQSGISEIDNRQGSLEKSIADADDEIKSIEKSMGEAKESVERLLGEYNEYSEQQKQSQSRLLNFEEKLKELNKELNEKEKALSEKKYRANMLSELEQNMEGYSGAVKAAVRAADKKILRGICAPISMLIKVPKKYTTAIEVSLGAAMQDIVTENEQDAKAAMEYLKKNKLGRATFLPVTRIRARELNEANLNNNPGFVAIASDLVECDNRYSDIIKNILARTVVAENMDYALAIAKKYSNRFKIVTLDGQVINAGGSMTGGSNSKSAGMLSRKNVIEELLAEAAGVEAEIKDLSLQIEQTTKESVEAEKEIVKLSQSVDSTDKKIKQYSTQQDILSDKLKLYTKQKETLQAEKESAQSRVEKYIAERSENESLITKIKGEIESYEGKLNENSAKLQEVSGKRESITDKLNSENVELTALLHDISAAEETVRGLKQRRQEEQERKFSLQEEIVQIKANCDELKTEIASIKEKNEKLRLDAEQTDERVSEKIAERDSHEKKTNELKILEKQKIQDREKVSGELVRLDEQKIAIRKEYDELNDKLYEQYELTRREAENLNIDIKDISGANKRLNQIKSSIKSLGTVNVGAIEEYETVSNRYNFMKQQLDDVEKSKAELEKIITELTVSMSEKFLVQFDKINDAFKNCFSEFFGGGSGEIVLEDRKNCLECPIEIKIQPPGKSVQNINLFSGGEKSLAAMALLFSVLAVAPAPFCIYDEVEAALDEVNVERFAKYMRKMTESTQFISITHRRGTMEEADVLYGVTMQEKGVSKLLRLNSVQIAEEMNLDN